MKDIPESIDIKLILISIPEVDSHPGHCFARCFARLEPDIGQWLPTELCGNRYLSMSVGNSDTVNKLFFIYSKPCAPFPQC